MAEGDRQRVDKWLWFARLAKTRTAAQQLAVSGRVRLNGDKISVASRTLKPGDVLTVALSTRVVVAQVLAPGTRRGPATEARALYEDLSPPPPVRRAEPVPPRRPAGSGRPTKRERRAVDAFRQGLAGDRDDFSDRGE